MSSPKIVNNQGHDIVVASAVLVVPGPYRFTKSGTLLFTLNELRESAAKWEGIPITLGHPPDSADLEDYALGVVRNPRVSDSLQADAYIDLRNLETVAPLILQSILRGERVPTSIGFDSSVTTRPGIVRNVFGGALQHPARVSDVEPNHLAIVPAGLSPVMALDVGVGINGRFYR